MKILICLFSYMKLPLLYAEEFLEISEGKDVSKSRELDE